MPRTLPAVLAIGAALLLAGCDLLLPPRLAVTPTARVVDVAVGTSTTFTVTNEGAAGSVLQWSFVAADLDAWPSSGALTAGASERVLVTVPSGAEGLRLTGRFTGPRQSVEVTVDVVRGPAITCDPESAFATASDTVRVLVGYRSHGIATAAARTEVARLTEAFGSAYGARVERRGAGTEYDLLRVAPTGADALLAALRARSDVAFAVRDVPIARSAIPDDKLYAAQWNLALFGAEPAWDVVDALPPDLDPVVIAVVDDGVAVDHVDLAARMLPGWDAHGNDGDVRNCTDHGTHVAGIAAADRNDGTGVAGVGSVSWVRLLPVKAWPDTTDPRQTTGTAEIVDAMRWAGGLTVTGFPPNAFPADVVNLSLGAANATLDAVFRPVIVELEARGVVVVAASGNGNTGDEPPVADGIQYPAAAGAVAIGSADHTFERSWFSSFGPGLDLLAPGGFAPSGSAGCTTVTSTGVTYANGVASETWTCKGGTSMATPYVSGAAALLLGVDPALRSSPDRAAAVADRLRAAAALAPGPNPDEYGAGVLCLDALLTSTSVCGVPVGP
ncbi:MAG: S8 family serine peptidase [Trueperaceae bacterium]|nr:S8 family serine peptidase [Trueperaceae bacterium]